MIPMRTPRSMALVSWAAAGRPDGPTANNSAAKQTTLLTGVVRRNKIARRECPGSIPQGVRRITDAGPAPRSRLGPPDRTQSCRNVARIAGPSLNHRDGQETKLPLPAVCVAQAVARVV